MAKRIGYEGARHRAFKAATKGKNLDRAVKGDLERADALLEGTKRKGNVEKLAQNFSPDQLRAMSERLGRSGTMSKLLLSGVPFFSSMVAWNKAAMLQEGTAAKPVLEALARAGVDLGRNGAAAIKAVSLAVALASFMYAAMRFGKHQESRNLTKQLLEAAELAQAGLHP
jgi:hypothetical protein